MALEAGTKLGPCEILSPLGAGGMGEIYRTKDTRLKRDKLVHQEPPVEVGRAAFKQPRILPVAQRLRCDSLFRMKTLRHAGSLARVVGLMAVVLSGKAWGLGTENFGDRPVDPSPEWPEGTLAVAESPGRVYARWVNGAEFFCYRGNSSTFNEFLKGFAAIKAPVHQLHIKAGSGKVTSFKGKEIMLDWRLDVTAGIARAHRLSKGDTEKALSPRLTYYAGGDGFAFENVILPQNIEVVLSDDLRSRPQEVCRFKEALEWRTAKGRWREFVGPFLQNQRDRLEKTWPKGRDLPIGGYVEFQSSLARKYLPDYKIYIIETSVHSISRLFAVSCQGELTDLMPGGFRSTESDGPLRNEMFSGFVGKQQIVIADADTAIDVGKLIEELVFAPGRWMYLKHNSNDFRVFKAWVFSNEGTVRDPYWQWYAQRSDEGWLVSKRPVGPPASSIEPLRWRLVLDDKGRLAEVMH